MESKGVTTGRPNVRKPSAELSPKQRKFGRASRKQTNVIVFRALKRASKKTQAKKATVPKPFSCASFVDRRSPTPSIERPGLTRGQSVSQVVYHNTVHNDLHQQQEQPSALTKDQGTNLRKRKEEWIKKSRDSFRYDAPELIVPAIDAAVEEQEAQKFEDWHYEDEHYYELGGPSYKIVHY